MAIVNEYDITPEIGTDKNAFVEGLIAVNIVRQRSRLGGARDVVRVLVSLRPVQQLGFVDVGN
jgi:hypothetical protein